METSKFRSKTPSRAERRVEVTTRGMSVLGCSEGRTTVDG